METFTALISFVMGASAGSFAQLVVVRLHTGERIVKGRSKCPHCKRDLRWFELVPIVSYLAQRAKCRRCGRGIKPEYLVVELVIGVLFALIAYGLLGLFERGAWSGTIFGATVIFWWIIASGLTIIFLYDLKHYLIPNVVLYPLIALSVVFFGITEPDTLLVRVVSGFSAAAFFYIIHVVTKGRGMGMGDVKFAILIGLLLGGLGTIAALFIAFVSGAIIGVILMIRRTKQLKSHIPFGPFLVAGTVFMALVSLYFPIDQLLNYFVISI